MGPVAVSCPCVFAEPVVEVICDVGARLQHHYYKLANITLYMVQVIPTFLQGLSSKLSISSSTAAVVCPFTVIEPIASKS